MKTLLTLLILLLIYTFNYSQKQIVTYHDPFTQTKIKERFSVNSQNQKNGLYTKYDDRGIKSIEINYTNGKPHGLAKEYYLPFYGFPGDEKIKIESNYTNGNRQGITKNYNYLNNGEFDLKKGTKILVKEEYFENDKKTREITYFENGKKEMDAYFVNGKQIKWYQNGQKAIELNLLNNQYDGPWIEWYENGQIGIEGTKKLGKWFGLKKEWYPNGKLKSEETYSQGNSYGDILLGKCYYFDSTGTKYKELNVSEFINGIQNIQVSLFYSNGDLYSTYLQTQNSYGNFSYTGEQSFYDKQGNLICHGKLNLDGDRDGEWFFMDQFGNEFKGNYRNGYKIGKWKIFYDKNENETVNSSEAAFYREITFTTNAEISSEPTTDFYLNGKKKFEGHLLAINPDVYNGICKFYDSLGNKIQEGNMKNGVKAGKWKEFYENGKIKLESHYEFLANYNSPQSFKTGLWSYFNSNEELEKVEHYEKDQIISTKTGQQAEEEHFAKMTKELRTFISSQKDLIIGKYSLQVEYGDLIVNKTKKKPILNAYLSIIEQIEKANFSSRIELTKTFQKLETIEKRMLELLEKETTELEKKLKKAKSVSEIEVLMEIVS